MVEGRANARAGLLGNPSDAHFGKAISILVRNFEAVVRLEESAELRIDPGEGDGNVFHSVEDLVERIEQHGYYGGDRLVKAAIKRFHGHCAGRGIRLSGRNFSLRFRSTIPRQVGLAGSSAIVTAVTRALMAFFELEIPDEILPTLILEAETEELGIHAGLQDRVVQVFGGCVYMDIERENLERRRHGEYHRLDPGLLPPLFVAYRPELGKVSGRVLSGIRERFERGDPFVIETLGRIAEIAAEGRHALEARDRERMFDLVNENFDLRSKIMTISKGNREMVETARGCGAAAKFAGSGGSIIGIYRDREMFDRLGAELGRIGAQVIEPVVARGDSLA